MDERHYRVKSRTTAGIFYDVDVVKLNCSCDRGRDGSPCPHQSYVALHYGIKYWNAFPANAELKRELYFIATGGK